MHLSPTSKLGYLSFKVVLFHTDKCNQDCKVRFQLRAMALTVDISQAKRCKNMYEILLSNYV